MKVERWEALVLAGTLALALALRAVKLDAGLWYDEVFTLTHFVRLPLGELLADFSALNNHMFYSLQAKASVALFGESAWSLRLPAVVFGVASLYVLWRLGREAAGRVPALFAVFLLAIGYHHVWFSQNARGFTGLLFWTLLATLIFIRGLQRPSRFLWSAYGVCVAAGMYTHLSAAFFFAAHALVYGVGVAMNRLAPAVNRQSSFAGFRDSGPVYGFVLAGILTLALNVPLLGQQVRAVGKVSAGSANSPMAEWASPLRTAHEILAGVGDLGVIAPIALIVAVVLAVAGGGAMLRRSPLLVAIYAVHIPLSLVILWALSFRIWPRYFFVDIGFVFLCVSMGAFVICERIGRSLQRSARFPLVPHLPFVAAALAMSAASTVMLVRNYAYPKQDFAGAVALVERERVPGDLAVSTGLASEPLKSYFAPAWPVIENAGQLQRELGSARTVWLVTAFQSHAKRRRADVMAIVEDRFDLVARLPGTLGDGIVRVYRSRPSLSPAPAVTAHDSSLPN